MNKLILCLILGITFLGLMTSDTLSLSLKTESPSFKSSANEIDTIETFDTHPEFSAWNISENLVDSATINNSMFVVDMHDDLLNNSQSYSFNRGLQKTDSVVEIRSSINDTFVGNTSYNPPDYFTQVHQDAIDFSNSVEFGQDERNDIINFDEVNDWENFDLYFPTDDLIFSIQANYLKVTGG